MATRVPTQIEAARQLAMELNGAEGDRAGAPVRRAFAIGNGRGRPPAARLLQQRESRGGSPGGSVRLRLYVSLLWACVSPPFDTARPAKFWATLLGLDDPANAGARRVRAALKELAERGYVRLSPAGTSTRITLLSELGDGSDYLPPYEALGVGAPKDLNQYFRIPTETWTGGYIAQMDGPATAMFLVLLAESRRERRRVWYSPEKADESYGVSAATRSRGIDRLRELGLVTVAKENVNSFAREARFRNVYEVPLLPKPERSA